ncbi:class I SAM-dependent methyltransferase [Tengunoibacter tsumagoiensis]|uniref:Methyltransferase domain-containing protein n=1 Tax=Tengunoibacter tsumagoiensis TaxID=2014871 RepID=A0A402A310_9CHLR|nr:class I SAM-dependent methyltransferase [Tengunoibacter tsumagoiensis]GCE13524.1 hypothetical protein KTT_33830 [Tengunoibacter tsumagoiensis]
MSILRWFTKRPRAISPSRDIPAASQMPYALPNNLQEVHRLDFQHYMLRSALEANYLAPLKPELVKTMLDVGCGTGRWMSEMAQQFPLSVIIGVDHVKPANTGLIFPANCMFQQQNVLEGLSFPDHQFDYVHQRLLVLALPFTYWSFNISELVRVTKPGGWIELVESDGMFTNVGGPGTATAQLNEWGRSALKPRGIDPSQVQNIPTILQNMHLENIQVQGISLPVGRWGGRLGQMALTNTQSALTGMKPLICSSAGIAEEEYDQLLAKVYNEFEEYHSSLQFTISYAQKPV